MAITPFLAMTAAEMHNCPLLPPKIAWMACHFSPYGRGLSNLPDSLPECSMLVVDDITPIHGHDPEVITQQLAEAVQRHKLADILLDFQRPGSEETAELAAYLTQSLPCSVIVSEHYGDNAPIFLSPVPPTVSLQDHIAPWKERDIWLDLGCCGEILTLTEAGCQCRALPPWEFPEKGFCEESLHCHYQIVQKEDSVVFTLWRTKEDLQTFLEEAENLGITGTIGLFQELSFGNLL